MNHSINRYSPLSGILPSVDQLDVMAVPPRRLAAGPARMELLERRLFFSLSDLDPSFGDGGKLTIDIGPSDHAEAVLVLEDGRILVGGYIQGAGRMGVLFRLNADGSLDTTFGQAGKVILTGMDEITALHLLSDGSIVAGGDAWRSAPGQFGGVDFAVARLSADGQLDAAFGVGGVATIDIRGGNDHVNDLAILSDGRIIAAGYAGMAGTSGAHFAVVSLNRDGSLDGGFSGGGIILETFGLNGVSMAYRVVVDAQDRILVGGSASGDASRWSDGGAVITGGFALARYNPDGTHDTSFDGDGLVVTVFPDRDATPQLRWDRAAIHDLVLLDNGQILAGGSGELDEFALARYNVDGSLDATFGQAGQVQLASGFAARYRLDVRADGTIAAAGLYQSLYVGLFDSQGQTLGSIVSAAPIRGEYNSVSAVAFQADGKVVIVSGVTSMSFPYDRVRDDDFGQLTARWHQSFDMGIVRLDRPDLSAPPPHPTPAPVSDPTPVPDPTPAPVPGQPAIPNPTPIDPSQPLQPIFGDIPGLIILPESPGLPPAGAEQQRVRAHAPFAAALDTPSLPSLAAPRFSGILIDSSNEPDEDLLPGLA